MVREDEPTGPRSPFAPRTAAPPLDLPPGDFDDRDDDDVLDGLPRVAAEGEEEARTVASMTGGGTPGTVPWSTERPHQSMTRTRDLSGRPLCSRCTRSAGTYHESSHHRFRAPTVVCGTTNTRRGGTPRRRRVVQTPSGWGDEAIEREESARARQRERERERRMEQGSRNGLLHVEKVVSGGEKRREEESTQLHCFNTGECVESARRCFSSLPLPLLRPRPAATSVALGTPPATCA